MSASRLSEILFNVPTSRYKTKLHHFGPWIAGTTGISEEGGERDRPSSHGGAFPSAPAQMGPRTVDVEHGPGG